MPEDLTIRDVVARLRRVAELRRDVWVFLGAPANTFHMVPIAERGWKGRHREGFWPYEAQDARN